MSSTLHNAVCLSTDFIHYSVSRENPQGNMTQMDLLVTNVAGLLATAVHEVLRVMGQAVSEYREESARIHQENRKLQRKLEELQKRIDASDAVQQVSSSIAVEEPSFESHPVQVLGSSPEHEPLVTQENEDPETQSLSFKEEKPSELHLELEAQHISNQCHSGTKSPTCDTGKSRLFSKLRSTSPTASKPASPDVAGTPDNSHFETALGVVSNKIKAESEPELPECSAAGQPESMISQDAGFGTLDNTPLRDRQSYSPVHSETTFVFQDQSIPPYAHILNSGTENIIDLPNGSGLMARKDSPHTCHVCGKTFATSSSLGAHFVCHSNLRPFACKCCQFRFSRLADLKKHERIHTGERPYNCSLCGRRFNRTENLRRHLRKVHHGALL
ncbi:B-cell CLL/lymphoma 6 member B protein isoform X2 [Electrophorus electricus]|uniref:B-cell CLL/lymphoma 6 member B protein isoform X2 n=1 Tax=Electrophorus electricus TaxID=8005 RepID=UPI0015D07AFA|nr:B-cell CLL/lymphoma 6 member B protein isoform X2 [Electrophorus electricus]